MAQQKKCDTKLESNEEIKCCQVLNDTKIAENSQMTFFIYRIDLIFIDIFRHCWFFLPSSNEPISKDNAEIH